MGVSADQLERPHCTQGESRSECSASESKQEAFGGGLAEEPEPADTEGGSDRVLLLASKATQQKQCCSIAAGDQ
jgi:anti-sigma factor ChrR (cupin superfamily)